MRNDYWFWIGLSDSTSLNNWKWSDGTSFSYSNWGKGQPGSKDEHCIFVSKTKSNPLTFFSLICFMQLIP